MAVAVDRKAGGWLPIAMAICINNKAAQRRCQTLVDKLQQRRQAKLLPRICSCCCCCCCGLNGLFYTLSRGIYSKESVIVCSLFAWLLFALQLAVMCFIVRFILCSLTGRSGFECVDAGNIHCPLVLQIVSVDNFI